MCIIQLKTRRICDEGFIFDLHKIYYWMLEQFLLVGFKLKDCWCKLVMMVLQQ